MCDHIIGGSRGGACRAHASPYGTQFFRFCKHFHQKAPASEVDIPPNGCMPPPLWEILDPPLQIYLHIWRQKPEVAIIRVVAIIGMNTVCEIDLMHIFLVIM